MLYDSQDASQLLQSSQVVHEPDMSVLERMKRRLGLLDDTQVVASGEPDSLDMTQEKQDPYEPVHLTQLAAEDAELDFFGGFGGAETQKVNESTQIPAIIEERQHDSPPQLPYSPSQSTKTPPEATQNASASDLTQKIDVSVQPPITAPPIPAHQDLKALFLSDESDEEERQGRIDQLAKHKQQMREQKQAAAAQLEADVSRTTLTDDENDLHEDTRAAIPSKDLEETEQFLSVQKRERDIAPQFRRIVTHSKDKLLAAFDDDNLESDHPPQTLTPPAKSSPLTSPMQKEDDSADELNVLDLIGQPAQQAKSIKKKSPIEAYASRLKDETANTDMVDLDSDSDSQNPIPDMPRQDKLSIKQRFLRKKLGKNSEVALSLPPHLRSLLLAYKDSKGGPQRDLLFAKLRRSNIDQLQALKEESGETELYEELQKDEEVMGSLLEREMERARNIRKKEKMRERQRKEHLEAMEDDDIPDSDDVDDEDEEEEEDEEEGEGGEEGDSGSEIENVIKRKRVVLSDDEDEDEDNDGQGHSHSQEPTQNEAIAQPFDLSAIRVDDSYMFGASGDVEHPEQDTITTSSQRPVVAINSPRRTRRRTSDALFKNLENTSPLQSQAEDTQLEENNFDVPSFHDITTQADVATQADDEVTPASLKSAREAISKNEILEEELDEEDRANIQEQIKLYEQKLRLKEIKTRRKRHRMVQQGLNKIIEGEAEESEDEWHGLGGADGEHSDAADSEDERMIDNSFNFDLNDAEVRKKFMEQYQIKDQRELEKLLDDIKNHRLTKRVRAQGLDIELSDEEDEILAAYRRQKLAEQRERAAQNKHAHQLLLTEKAKAFFESMEEDSQPIRLDEDEEEAVFEAEDTQESGKKVLRIEELFVQKQLSFLSSTTESYLEQQRLSRVQHGFASDDEHEDLNELKRSISSLARAQPEIVAEKAASDTDDDVMMPAFKRPSLVQSFRNSGSGSEGSFSGVTISKQYKAATSAKGSISSMSKRRVKSVKEQKLERRLNRATKGRGIFSGSGFE